MHKPIGITCHACLLKYFFVRRGFISPRFLYLSLAERKERAKNSFFFHVLFCSYNDILMSKKGEKVYFFVLLSLRHIFVEKFIWIKKYKRVTYNNIGLSSCSMPCRFFVEAPPPTHSLRCYWRDESSFFLPRRKRRYMHHSCVHKSEKRERTLIHVFRPYTTASIFGHHLEEFV